MKKYFFIAVMALSLTILQGCDEEKDVVLWEFTPADVMIHVVNANGDNLLSPETPGCIMPEEVEAIYNGKVYEYRYTFVVDGKPVPYKPFAINDTPDSEKTREISATWYGLHDGYSGNDLEPTINFGTFDPTVGYRNEEFEVVWPDGSRDRIAFDLFVDWTDKDNPQYVKNLYLNGNPVETIVVVK